MDHDYTARNRTVVVQDNCITDHVSVTCEDGLVPRVVCATDDVVINGVKFRAHILTGMLGFRKPSTRHLTTQVPKYRVWDTDMTTPHIKFTSDLCVHLEFKSNGKRVTIKRPNTAGYFCASNGVPK